MPVYSVAIEDFPGVVKRDLMEKRDRLLSAMRTTVKAHAPHILLGVISAVRPRPPVDRGTYRMAWQVRDTEDGVAVFNPLPYAGVLELGRRPGKMPPIDALARWVIRKGLVGSHRTKWTTTEWAAARAIAFAIARKMRAQGWPFSPTQPFSILAKATGLIMAEVRKVIDEVMRA